MSHHPSDVPPDMRSYDLIGIGFGPSNLSLAICLEEIAAERGRPLDSLFIEKQQKYAWHGDTLVDQSSLQISFLKDLVSLRNPTSPYSFVNYLHRHGRLVDFINMSTFYPSRVEFDDYLRWVAGHFSKQALYGEEVLRVEPVPNGRQIDRLRVVSRSAAGEERSRLTRALVVASGGKPKIPEAFRAFRNEPRIFHHANYLTAMSRLPLSRLPQARVAVVGGGQSAVEAFIDLNDNFPSVKVELILRASALKPADSSPFVNEVFAPEYIDLIFHEPPEQQQALVAEYQNTNYGVADIELIERIYAILYRQKVIGQARHALLSRTHVKAVSASATGITLTLCELTGDKTSERTYDAVVLATGYERQSHRELLAPLQDYLGAMRTNRQYRVETDPHLAAPIYLQGFSEATHGLSETLLSVLPIRSERIGRALHGHLMESSPSAVDDSRRGRSFTPALKESSLQLRGRFADIE